MLGPEDKETLKMMIESPKKFFEVFSSSSLTFIGIILLSFENVIFIKYEKFIFI